MELFARGKRGFVYLIRYKDRPAILKKKNPVARTDTIGHEAAMLQELNPFGIGPVFYAFADGALIREFIEGEEFIEYLEKASKQEIIRVLTEIFYQCRELDLLGVNKLEMTRPYKHVLVSVQTPTRKKGEVVQIDFERCRHTDRPKNVTQFVQCISRGRLQEIFTEKEIEINKEKLQEITKKYKKKLEKKHFDKIIKIIGGRRRSAKTFTQHVYDLCAEIPEGEVSTYKKIAQRMGTKAYRAVGQALKNNPYAPRIPCHRVVSTNGTIGGFQGEKKGESIRKKIQMLEQEGITIQQNKIKNFDEILSEPKKTKKQKKKTNNTKKKPITYAEKTKELNPNKAEIKKETKETKEKRRS